MRWRTTWNGRMSIGGADDCTGTSAMFDGGAVKGQGATGYGTVGTWGGGSRPRDDMAGFPAAAAQSRLSWKLQYSMAVTGFN